MLLLLQLLIFGFKCTYFIDFPKTIPTIVLNNEDNRYFKVKIEESAIKLSDIDEPNYDQRESSNTDEPIESNDSLVECSIDNDVTQTLEVDFIQSPSCLMSKITHSLTKPDEEISNTSGNSTFNCLTCCKSFSRRANLQKHETSVHMIQHKLSTKTGRNRHKRGPSPKLSSSGNRIL